jgi:integrase/DNA-binding transcriptional regulator YhcF (GntR family)
VSVYAGIDPLTKRRHYMREVVPAGPKAASEAEKVMRRLASQVDERRHPRTNATVNQLLDKHFELVTLERSTLATYRGYADKHIRPLIGSLPVGSLDADLFDSFYGELRRCREHCDSRAFVEHRTDSVHECDARCRPHVCKPLGASTVRQIHFILSGALKRAVRWRWLSANPITQAEPPAAPKPNPQPPTAREAARILAEAWSDPEWGTLVWLAMVTGMRRGELCGIRWRHVDLEGGVLALDRSIGQRGSQMWEKDTKTHQHRRIALDPATVEVLIYHRSRCVARAEVLGFVLGDGAFVFSLAPDGSTYLQPNSVGQRYAKMVDHLGIQTSIHKLRHYSATELIAAGVDVRTVAGRLGHGGGGTTTLRTYAAWVSESDQRAATSLFARMPARPTSLVLLELDEAGSGASYERIAAALRSAIGAGEAAPGGFLPSTKAIAEKYGVSVGTAHRAVSQLKDSGLLVAVPGRGVRVINARAAELASPEPEPQPAAAPVRQMLDLEIRHLGVVVSRLTADVDPESADELRQVLVAAIRRRGGHASEIAEYEMDLRRKGDAELLATFVAIERAGGCA